MASQKMYGRDLIDAILNRDGRTVKTLMSKGANTDFVLKGDKAIHLAARYGQYKIMKYLLEGGEDVNKPNQYGNTALHFAAREGDKKIIKLLLDNGADLNSQHEDGETPLHNCVGYQSMDVIESYIRLGMDVNAQSKKGETPLHLAVKYSREESVEALLLCNADASIENMNGKRADQVAKKASIGEQIRTHGLLAAAMESGYIQSHGTKLSHRDVKSPLHLARVGITIESMDIPTDFPTAFYCRREKSENTTLKLNNAEDEHIISDVFIFRVRDVYRDIDVKMTTPLYAVPTEKETLVFRSPLGDKGKVVGDVFIKKDEPYCTVDFTMVPERTSTFVFCVSPRTEVIDIGEEETVFKSDVGFSMEIPEGAFKENTTLSLKVFEPVDEDDNEFIEDTSDDETESNKPTKQENTEYSHDTRDAEKSEPINVTENEHNKIQANGSIVTSDTIETSNNETSRNIDQLSKKKKKKKDKRKKGKRKSKDESKLLSDVYEVNLSGEQPTRGLMMKIPLKDKSRLGTEQYEVIRIDDEGDQTITKLSVDATVTEDGNVVFEASHFSMYVIIPKTTPDQNQSSGDLSTIYDHVQNSRQRKQYARFFMMLQQPDKEDIYGRHVLLVECIRAGSSKKRRSRWKQKGFEKQKPKNSGKLLLAPGQEFIIRLQGDAKFDNTAGETGTRRLVFSPHRASFQPYQIRLPPMYKNGMATVSLYPIDGNKENIGKQPERNEAFIDDDFKNMEPITTLKLQLHLPPDEDPFPEDFETIARYKTFGEIKKAEVRARKRRELRREETLLQIQYEIQEQGLPSRPQSSNEATRFRKPGKLKLDV